MDPGALPAAIDRPRKIILPFSLLDGDGLPTLPSCEEDWNILFNLFADTCEISTTGFFLVIRVTKLPPKPWPVSVAGLPLFLTTETDYAPLLPSKHGLNGHALKHLDMKKACVDDALGELTKYFDSQDVAVNEVRWEFPALVIVIPEDTDLTKLPSWCGTSICRYQQRSSAPPTSSAAKRLQEPSPTVRDDSQYLNLRPGIMLSSGRLGQTPSELLTSSGVLVQDKDGNEFITVASHGFPNGTEVFHPTADGIVVANITKRIRDTDIAFAKLIPGLKYENETFGTDLSTPTILNEICDPRQLKIGTTVFMDSPFTGFVEGMVVSRSRCRVPAGSEHWWIRLEWVWMGQNWQDANPDGCCGSPMWDADGRVVAFFRYLIIEGPYAGYGVGISAIELEESGYFLA